MRAGSAWSSWCGHARGWGIFCEVLHSPHMEKVVSKERNLASGIQSVGMLGVALVLSIILVPPAHSTARPETGERLLVVEFYYFDSHAEKVSVVGSFNQWAPDAHVMEKDGDRWSLQVLLPPGRYEYAFLIDDRVWKADPASLVKEKSGFGVTNSILILE
jgi:hypothetical protein